MTGLPNHPSSFRAMENQTMHTSTTLTTSRTGRMPTTDSITQSYKRSRHRMIQKTCFHILRWASLPGTHPHVDSNLASAAHRCIASTDTNRINLENNSLTHRRSLHALTTVLSEQAVNSQSILFHTNQRFSIVVKNPTQKCSHQLHLIADLQS